jgi:hypothetical protein
MDDWGIFSSTTLGSCSRLLLHLGMESRDNLRALRLELYPHARCQGDRRVFRSAIRRVEREDEPTDHGEHVRDCAGVDESGVPGMIFGSLLHKLDFRQTHSFFAAVIPSPPSDARFRQIRERTLGRLKEEWPTPTIRPNHLQ